MVQPFEQHVPALKQDPRITALTRDDNGLILRIENRAIGVMGDFDQARTLVWGVVRKLAPAEVEPAALAATRFNQDCFACDGLAMGCMADQNLLVLGRSLDGHAVSTNLLLEAALEVRGALDDALERFLEICACATSLPAHEEDVAIIRG